MKSKHKILSLILLVTTFAFNLVLLPANANEGCHSDHSQDNGAISCYCGVGYKKSCDSKVPSLSKGQCGLTDPNRDFSIPAHEHPTMLFAEYLDLFPCISTLKEVDSVTSYITCMPPVEHPPSLL